MLASMYRTSMRQLTTANRLALEGVQWRCGNRLTRATSTKARSYTDSPSLHRPLHTHLIPSPFAKSVPLTRQASTSAQDGQIAPSSAGILSWLPKSAVPFAELSRLEKPAGTAYLFMPCLFSTLLASTIVSPAPAVLTILNTGLLFFAGATVMRGAGCTINDLYDRNLDKLVTRTRTRPLARGAVSVPAAITWAGVQCLLGLGILVQFSSNTILMALPSMLLVCTYPLAKRITHYPQFVLGCAFSWGAMLGFPALGMNLVNFNLPQLDFNVAAVQNFVSSLQQMHIELGDANVMAAAGLLYASCISWTLLYDTIYAFQDIRDDRKAGIKSTAQAFSSELINANVIDRRPKTVLGALGVVQTALLAGSGYMLGLSPLFYCLSCGGCAGSLALMVRSVNLNDVSSCARWFRMGCWLTGGATSIGLFAEYMSRST